MEAYLPYSIGSRDLPSLFALCAAVNNTDDSNIILDGSRVTFIDPQGLAVLGALLAPKSTARVSMPWLPVNICGYMDRMNFFDQCDVQDIEIPNWNKHDRRSSLTELTCIESSVESDQAASRLADSITGALTNSDPNEEWTADSSSNQFGRFRYPIWYSLSELIDNALSHARLCGNLRAKVWVAAQYYEGPGIVRMAIVDNGCGMLATLRDHPELRSQDHLAAIEAALRPKVSCNRDGSRHNNQGNQGVGLTTTARIAKSANGGLTIASGDSLLTTQRGQEGGLLPRGGAWPGVSVGFHCRRHALPAVRVRELLPIEPRKVAVTFSDV